MLQLRSLTPLTLFSIFISAPIALSLPLPSEVKAQNSTPYTSQCFKDAVARYGIERAQQICQNATPSTSSCLNDAVPRYGVERARQICQNATPSTSSCLNDAVPRYGVERAQQICNGATSATSQCFNENTSRFGIERARQICAPTPNNPLAIQECIKSLTFDPQGRRTQISESAAAIACQRSVR
jgi:hypothetical protein